eukprot:snap_masked-scaffold_98-processed-gene-0.14-mRNA-1 protein AED:1.00 eAED:1.00 QI:0/-1/0/0/-1/1/1/0/61
MKQEARTDVQEEVYRLKTQMTAYLADMLKQLMQRMYIQIQEVAASVVTQEGTQGRVRSVEG